jgi:hypothetical protein
VAGAAKRAVRLPRRAAENGEGHLSPAALPASSARRAWRRTGLRRNQRPRQTDPR